ncbi:MULTISPECIES: hypothetical protein [Burkholderia]|uniref:hypothetical protein n=1 Tax=Burkholderia TaxID=32008 RepID=UPI00158270F0|nr:MULTISPECIES: hypothetical protein [Burkholderia]
MSQENAGIVRAIALLISTWNPEGIPHDSAITAAALFTRQRRYRPVAFDIRMSM